MLIDADIRCLSGCVSSHPNTHSHYLHPLSARQSMTSGATRCAPLPTPSLSFIPLLTALILILSITSLIHPLPHSLPHPLPRSYPLPVQAIFGQILIGVTDFDVFMQVGTSVLETATFHPSDNPPPIELPACSSLTPLHVTLTLPSNTRVPDDAGRQEGKQGVAQVRQAVPVIKLFGYTFWSFCSCWHN